MRITLAMVHRYVRLAMNPEEQTPGGEMTYLYDTMMDAGATEDELDEVGPALYHRFGFRPNPSRWS